MKTLSLIITLIVFSSNLTAQNTGLYGKRNYVEINSTVYSPMLSWIFRNGTTYSSNGSSNYLVKKLDVLNYGFHIILGRAGKKNVAASLEFGCDFANIAGPEYFKYSYTQDGYQYEDYVYIKHEMLDIRTITIMPKIEFSNKGAILPVGLNHQIGLGITRTSVMDKDYVYDLQYGSSSLSQEDIDNLNDKLIDKSAVYKGMTLLYAFNIRTPVSKSIMINYGLRYTLNLRNFNQYFRESGYYYDEDDMKRDIGFFRMTNVITFNLGLTYSF